MQKHKKCFWKTDARNYLWTVLKLNTCPDNPAYSCVFEPPNSDHFQKSSLTPPFSPSDLVVRRVSFNRKWLKALVWIKMMELKKISAVPVRIFKAVMMGAWATLAVLDADWSVITKYGGVFDLMNINELSLSVPATVGRPLICADQLLTSDINPHVVTRTFIMRWSVPWALTWYILT